MLKSNKRILMKYPGRLTDAELIKLEEILRVSEDLRKAYQLKQEFIHMVLDTLAASELVSHC